MQLGVIMVIMFLVGLIVSAIFCILSNIKTVIKYKYEIRKLNQVITEINQDS